MRDSSDVFYDRFVLLPGRVAPMETGTDRLLPLFKTGKNNPASEKRAAETRQLHNKMKKIIPALPGRDRVAPAAVNSSWTPPPDRPAAAPAFSARHRGRCAGWSLPWRCSAAGRR